MTSSACPCGSGKAQVHCCDRFISGNATAVTAEQLMRSRYTAYVLGDVDYLKATWHPDTCPESIELEDVRWLGLKIRNTSSGGADDSEGKVEFVARYKVGGRGFRLHEVSRFVKTNDRWYYLDGAHRAAE
jgi:SEC-C motif-containing protein